MRAIRALPLAMLLLAQPSPLLALTSQPAPPEFGDDSGTWALDGECDDLRFKGESMAEWLLPDEVGTDASDCRAAFYAWKVELDPLFKEPETPRDIVWGDDESAFAHDGQCDDLRFTGYYAASMVYLAEDIGHDATDCRSLFVKGVARWKGAALET